ncbi:hypothetical protein Bbelb_423580 [Branchiostoma belcheri]|nr:hypothetical protein Bbelb_423580 [Branchiostoma belcheri]
MYCGVNPQKVATVTTSRVVPRYSARLTLRDPSRSTAWWLWKDPCSVAQLHCSVRLLAKHGPRKPRHSREAKRPEESPILPDRSAQLGVTGFAAKFHREHTGPGAKELACDDPRKSGGTPTDQEGAPQGEIV